MIQMMFGWLDLNSGFSFRHAENANGIVPCHSIAWTAKQLTMKYEENFKATLGEMRCEK